MNSTLYVVVMVGTIAALVAVIVPALFWKRCPSCSARNLVDAAACARCSGAFPADRPHDASE